MSPSAESRNINRLDGSSTTPTPEKVALQEKLDLFDTHFDPKIVAELNGQHVKVVKFRGEFVWHKHDREDELFLVLDGSFEMQFRDRTVVLERGELIVVPRGVEHCPRAEAEVHVLVFEPVGTLNTGDSAAGPKTVREPERL